MPTCWFCHFDRHIIILVFACSVHSAHLLLEQVEQDRNLIFFVYTFVGVPYFLYTIPPNPILIIKATTSLPTMVKDVSGLIEVLGLWGF